MAAHIIGTSSALWNQHVLVKGRNKYGANDLPVGFTGRAQILESNELEINVLARLDGEYAEKIGFMMDVRCFLGTKFCVLRSDGVVESGTEKIKKPEAENSM